MTSQLRMSVVSSKNGSTLAVLGSGISSMSDASMPFQPAIEEPSKAWPALDLASSRGGERGAVEGMARAELVFVEMGDGHGHVLLLAAGVGEAEVDELDFVFLHH